MADRQALHLMAIARPGCKISGGKVLSAGTRKTGNRLTAILRMAAVSVGKTETALVLFIAVWAPELARPRPSLPPHARSPSCSTTRCALA